LRVYQWDQPSISIGYSQNWEALKDSLPPWPVVRRWTGGGTVWHDVDTTYSFIVPAADPWSRTRPLDSYRLIHQSLAEHLGSGLLAGEAERKEGALCFQAPAIHDIMREGEKIAGAGQRRSRHGLLHQGSLRLKPGDEFWINWAHALGGSVITRATTDAVVMEQAGRLAVSRYAAP
jgi:lipoate-protein ligase A